ncbi:nuclear transport factor 2 family protein [Flavobacterium chuncheonense]|uniref:Nuclear transport factor 2 family protein n=1 Tax=Flavobacterium chuncheonense TaxID=2026653 RepID=A0ABW5YHF5_9FLAO
MKNLLFSIILMSSTVVFAQNDKPKAVVETFFKAFHKQDTIALKTICHPDITLQSIMKLKGGVDKLVNEEYRGFLKAIATIPDTVKFEERLLSYNVQVDEALAHVWTPYEFYVNDKLSHTGVNSFTLFKDDKGWRIINIIDTRNKK